MPLSYSRNLNLLVPSCAKVGKLNLFLDKQNQHPTDGEEYTLEIDGEISELCLRGVPQGRWTGSLAGSILSFDSKIDDEHRLPGSLNFGNLSLQAARGAKYPRIPQEMRRMLYIKRAGMFS